MKVGIIGSGGREHSLCLSLKKSQKITKIFCIPGNAGTDQIAQNVDLDIGNFKKLKDFILEKKIEMVIVGPEKPLVEGITDYLNSFNIKVFGPNKKASQLEGSKIFTKKLCEKYNIPTAKFGIFEDEKKAKGFLKNCNYPIVVKADGLAAGKGVYICENFNQSSEAILEISIGFTPLFDEKEKMIIICEFAKKFFKGLMFKFRRFGVKSNVWTFISSEPNKA